MEKEIVRNIYDRVSDIESKVVKVDEKVDRLDDRVDLIDEKHNERHLELSILVTRLQGSLEGTERNTKAAAKSIDNLVYELRTSNENYNKRIDEHSKEIGDIKKEQENKKFDVTMELEEKKLSNTTLGIIAGGIFMIIQVTIQVVGPLLAPFFK